jgi:hypothetical protein
LSSTSREKEKYGTVVSFDQGWGRSVVEEDGWDIMYDDGSGRYYEIHRVMGESRWLTGETGRQEDEQSWQIVEEMGAAAAGGGGGGGGGGREECLTMLDEETGRWYYSNVVTGETSWVTDIPDVDVQAEPVVGEWDEGAESWYYVSQWTGASTWEIPTNVVDLQYRNYDVADTAVVAAAMPSSVVMTTQVRALAMVDDGRDWHEQWYDSGRSSDREVKLSSSSSFSDASLSAWVPVHDEESGMYFYENGVTGETQWNSPWESEEVAAATTVDEVDVWEAVWDDTSHAWYYCNTLTGETRW